MQNMKIPDVTAVFATTIEFFGGLLLIISSSCHDSLIMLCRM